MKYNLSVSECIERTKTYVIEVDSEEDGDNFADMIADEIEDADHPDDIIDIIESYNGKILEYIEGAESVEYELE